jgi:hypothetical protein
MSSTTRNASWGNILKKAVNGNTGSSDNAVHTDDLYWTEKSSGDNENEETPSWLFTTLGGEWLMLAVFRVITYSTSYSQSTNFWIHGMHMYACESDVRWV